MVSRRHAKGGAGTDPAWIERENTYADAYASTDVCWRPPDRRPTAIVTMSDLMAIGVINAPGMPALSRGVAGGHRVRRCARWRFLRPSLTSLRQPIAEVGSAW
ncbi:MAG: hypothetical protein IPM84_21860 [Anaerolineae bacterium]|nr:hypothetical protein [Anaerolineae bacterium]